MRPTGKQPGAFFVLIVLFLATPAAGCWPGSSLLPVSTRAPLRGEVVTNDVGFVRDGTIPADNPFPGSPVYAYGLRNGFGLAWHPQTGLLYQSENGANCDDELNLIERGRDYGWGVYAYDDCPYPDDHGAPPFTSGTLSWPRPA